MLLQWLVVCCVLAVTISKPRHAHQTCTAKISNNPDQLKKSSVSSTTFPKYDRTMIGLLAQIRGGATKTKGKKKSKAVMEDDTDKSTSSTTITTLLNSAKAWFVSLVKSLMGSSKPKQYSPKSKVAVTDHISTKYKSSDSNSRIQKELKDFLSNPPDNCKVSVGKSLRTWIITLTGAKDTLYAGEKYKLKVEFPKDYPAKPPAVYFLKPCPKHEHIYSNGDICLNLLGRDWRPTMTVQILAVSILSMLSSAKEKTMPQDNAMHADAAPGQQQDNWMYHDDRC